MRKPPNGLLCLFKPKAKRKKDDALLFHDGLDDYENYLSALNTPAHIPKPGPEQLLVKIDSAALNPLDWKARSFGLYVKDFPAVLGIDGTVEEVGANVSGLEKGDRA